MTMRLVVAIRGILSSVLEGLMCLLAVIGALVLGIGWAVSVASIAVTPTIDQQKKFQIKENCDHEIEENGMTTTRCGW